MAILLCLPSRHVIFYVFFALRVPLKEIVRYDLTHLFHLAIWHLVSSSLSVGLPEYNRQLSDTETKLAQLVRSSIVFILGIPFSSCPVSLTIGIYRGWGLWKQELNLRKSGACSVQGRVSWENWFPCCHHCHHLHTLLLVTYWKRTELTVVSDSGINTVRVSLLRGFVGRDTGSTQRR